MFEVYNAKNDEELDNGTSNPEYAILDPIYVALENTKRFRYTFQSKEPFIEPNPSKNLQVSPNLTSSNNPPPPGPISNARNIKP